MTSQEKRMHKWELKFEPRNWQKTALRDWTKQYRGIIRVVTGGGKTIFAFLCIKAFLTKYSLKQVIVVVPTITLLDQWFISFQDEFGVSKDEITTFSGSNKKSTFNKVNIVVINTARSVLPKLANKSDFLLIVDECHRAGSPLNGKAIIGNYAATLGLSATPERDYDAGFENFMLPNLGKIIYSYGYKDALHDKVICPYELLNVKVELLQHERKKYREISRRISILTAKNNVEEPIIKAKLNQLLIQRARISAGAILRIPVTSKIVEQNNGQRIIVFHESIQGANHIYDVLRKRNQSVTIYHSKIGKHLRRDNLRLYRRGRFNILVTCKALDEGMNAPETTMAIIASSTASYRQRIQRLGRVLRPAPNKTKAKIYTLYATDVEKERLTEEYTHITDPIKISWLTSTVNHGKNISE